MKCAVCKADAFTSVGGTTLCEYHLDNEEETMNALMDKADAMWEDDAEPMAAFDPLGGDI